MMAFVAGGSSLLRLDDSLATDWSLTAPGTSDWLGCFYKDGIVYAVGNHHETGNLRVFDADDGSLLGEANVSDPGGDNIEVSGIGADNDGNIYCFGFGALVKFDSDINQVYSVWTSAAQSHGHLAVVPDASALYVVGGKFSAESMESFDPSDGSIRWDTTDGGWDLQDVKVTSGGRVFAGSTGGRLLEFDPSDGSTLWSEQLVTEGEGNGVTGVDIDESNSLIYATVNNSLFVTDLQGNVASSTTGLFLRDSSPAFGHPKIALGSSMLFATYIKTTGSGGSRVVLMSHDGVVQDEIAIDTPWDIDAVFAAVSGTSKPLRLITRTSNQQPNAPRVPGPNTYW